MIQDYIQRLIANVQISEEFLDEETLEMFKYFIFSSGNIFIAGVGRSGIVGESFGFNLISLGLNVKIIGKSICPPIFEDDCVIAISNSGETDCVIDVVKNAKENGASILAITSNPESTLCDYADCYLFIKGESLMYDENYIKRRIEGEYVSLFSDGRIFELTALIFLEALFYEILEALFMDDDSLEEGHAVSRHGVLDRII